MQPDRASIVVDPCHQTVTILIDCSTDPVTVEVGKFVPASWGVCKNDITFTYVMDSRSAGAAIVYLPDTDVLTFDNGTSNDHVKVLGPGESATLVANGKGSTLVQIFADCGQPVAPTTDTGAVSVIMIDP